MSLKGSTAEFPLDVLIRLLRDQKKTGELTLRSSSGEGALGLADGRVVVAVYGDEQPVPALGAIFEMAAADFEFTPWDEAPPANLEGELDELLRKAREHREWMASVRQVIPNDRVRFRLSERAAEQGAVTFTPDRWRVVLAVNGTRDVNDIASNLHIDRDAALNVLSGLVKDGVIDTIEPTVEAPFAAPPPAPVAPPQYSAPAPVAEPQYIPPPEPEYVAPPQPEYVAPPAPEPEPEPEPEPAPPVAEVAPPEPAPAMDWGTPSPPQEVAPQPEPAAPAMDWGAPPPAQEVTPPPPVMLEPEPAPAPAMDDRLAALFGTPAPLETPPAPAPAADQWSAPAATDWSTPAPAADQWTTPAAPEAPAPDLTADPRLGALTMPPVEAPAAPASAAPKQAETSPYPFGSTTAPANEWAPPATIEAPPPKKKGLFGRFGGGAKEEAATAAPTEAAPGRASSRVGQLAAFSNALLTEYNSGQYGKQRIDDRMPSLLMRVDEQADPIDRPLPVLDDRLDVEALDRVSLPEGQAAPYLAMLVTTIYGDAEKTFGKDKAKKGYRAAQQQVFAGDTSSLGGSDLAGKLPKV